MTVLLTRFICMLKASINLKRFWLKKREDVGIKQLNDSKRFIEYSQCMNDVYNIDNYNPTRTRKISTEFHDMIADNMSNKKFQTMVKELAIRCMKLNILLAFIFHFYFFVPKEVRLNSTHYLIINIHNKRESQNIATNHSTDID